MRTRNSRLIAILTSGCLWYGSTAGATTATTASTSTTSSMTSQYQNLIASIADGGGGGGGAKKKAPAETTATVTTPLAPSVDVDKLLPYDPNQKNYTPTNDPNVFMGRNGYRITKQAFDQEQNDPKSLNWRSFDDYANWIGGWAHPDKPLPKVSPYYRTYPEGKINGGDILQLYMRRDPKIDAILGRNVAAPGEVPQYGPEDSDLIRQMIANPPK